MIITIYVLSILYIIIFFLYKFLKILFIPAKELKRRINSRVIYWFILTILDWIFQNIYILIAAIIIFITITCFLIFIYIYYRFILVPISKIWPIGCEIYKILAFFPIAEVKTMGIFSFLDKLIFNSNFKSGIAINIILESTIKHSVPRDTYNKIKDVILKDSKFSIEEVCGDLSKKLENKEQMYNNTNLNLSEQDIIELKKDALIKHCVNTQIQNNVYTNNPDVMSKITNKLYKNACTAKFSDLKI